MEKIRNFSLSLWDGNDNFIDLLKSANSDTQGQSFNEYFSENINGEKTLTFSIPMYLFDEHTQHFNINPKWQSILNEQKIRLTFYENSRPKRIEEFVLKEYTESRNGEEKIAECSCISLAVYELGKIGWGITLNELTPTLYETLDNNCPELLTLEYWLDKIFYKFTSIGRISNEDELTKYLRGHQLRDDEGYAIDNVSSMNKEGKLVYSRIDEPKATLTDYKNSELQNPYGWHWEIQATFENDPNKRKISDIYEKAYIEKYVQVAPNDYQPFSYQKVIGTADSTKVLRPHPIPEDELTTYTYVTDIKRRLVKVERSNIFTIIADLCETFEVWAHFQYTYDDNGKIVDRKILFKTESTNDEVLYDFSYGKNLVDCKRESESHNLITKLFIPDIDSTMVDGNIISIKNSTANPSGEGFIYNFDYFYELGTLDEKDKEAIQLYLGTTREYNQIINALQDRLAPLYDRQLTLDGKVEVAEGSVIGLQDNIQTLQEKIDAIPEQDQVIESWSDYETENNHIGELRTIAENPDSSGAYPYYISFGREDVLCGKTSGMAYRKAYMDNEELRQSGTFYMEGYNPKIYKRATWGKEYHIGDGEETATDFFLPEPNNDPTFTADFKFDYTDAEGIPANTFLRGIWLTADIKSVQLNARNYARVRYKYCPLIFYYTQIKYYWDKLEVAKQELAELKRQALENSNKIFELQLTLDRQLIDKSALRHNFETKYSNVIKEGYWSPSDYQNSKETITKNITKTSHEYHQETESFADFGMNNSLNNFSYYFPLIPLSSSLSEMDLDVDGIEMTTLESGNLIPRYRGNDWELYNSYMSNEDVGKRQLIIGISPSLIDSYEMFDKINAENGQRKQKKCHISYSLGDTRYEKDVEWIKVTEEIYPIAVKDCIYLTDDNLMTSSLKVTGVGDEGNIEFQPLVDYTYNFKSIGYADGEIVDLNKQETYDKNVTYDYVTRVELKLTKNTLPIYNSYKVSYDTETTLQYFFNDCLSTSEKYAKPQVTYDISVLNLSSLKGYENYFPKVGQKVPIWDLEMNLNGYMGLVTSVEYNLELMHDTKVTIATYTTQFEDLFKKLTAAASTVSYNETNLLRAAESVTNSNSLSADVFQNSFDNNNFQIQMGVNNDVVIDKTSGIVLSDRDNGKGVKIIGNGIFLSPNINDENPIWKTGITGDGINANALVAGTLDTKNINICNSSDGQVRFAWNEEGLFAYADKDNLANDNDGIWNPSQKKIDYNKYVKLNQDGLRFVDSERLSNGEIAEHSSLSLGWEGLRMTAQDNALTLDGEEGLKITDKNDHNRLHLGRIGNDEYGLVLRDEQGHDAFRNDTHGQLWLSGQINVGGEIDQNTKEVIDATAGVYGKQETTNPLNVLGLIRNEEGTLVWSNEPVRFWAGPQTPEKYLSERNIEESEISGNSVLSSAWGEVVDYFDNDKTPISPTTAKFKVGADGTLVASGIDVGGWIGGGTYLRSKDREVILRSKDYEVDDEVRPAIAVGRPLNGLDDGSNYNFRVEQDGTVYASAMNIVGGSISSTGININDVFKVNGETGEVTANAITITGGAGNWIIDSPNFQVDNQGQIGAGAGGFNSFYSEDYPFSVDKNGNIRFKGSIYAYSSMGWKKGLDSTSISVIGKTAVNIEVVNGLIIDVS